jgi:hypothetical protein
MATTAELRLTARDETAAAFSSVMSGLGRLEGGVGKLQGLFSSALGGLGLGLGLQQIFTETVEAERAQARLESVLRSTGYAAGITAGQIEELAQQLKATTAFDDDELKAGMASLLRFRDISGEAFRDAAGLATDLAVAMNTDLASAFQTIGRLGQEPTETLKSLKGAGFALKGEQLELAKALEESGEKAQAQKIAFDELRRTIGGSAQGEAGGLYGSSRDVAKAWGDMLKAIGQTPFVTDIALTAMAQLSKAAADVQAVIDADWGDKLRVAWKGADAAGWGKNQTGATGSWGPSTKEEAAEAGRRAREDEALWEQAKASDDKIGKWLEEQDRKRAARASGRASSAKREAEQARREQERALEAARAQRVRDDAEWQGVTDLERFRDTTDGWGGRFGTPSRVDFAAQRARDDAEWMGVTDLERFRDTTDGWGVGDRFGKPVRDEITKTSDAARELGITFQSAFEDAIIEGKDLSDVLQGIEKDLIRVAARKLVTEPLVGAASSLFDGFSLGKLLEGVIGSANGNVMTSAGPLQLQRFARGGVANRPMLSMFGEGRQPEAYVPLPDGRSIPVTMQGGGGGGEIAVAINVDARGGGGDMDPAGAAQQARAIADGVRAVVKTELVNALRNGGVLRR